MLVGSQLKNAQLEVVTSLPTENNVRGRIVYLHDSGTTTNSGIWMHNGSKWERILDPGLYDSIVGGDSTADGTTPAAPTGDNLNALSTKVANIISGDQAIDITANASITGNDTDISNITNGTTSLLSNKTPPQEMCHTWNVNGRLKAENFPDGKLIMPFAAEITGIGINLDSPGSSGSTVFYLSKASSATGVPLYSTILSTNATIDYNANSRAMFISNVTASTGVATVAAQDSEKLDSGDVLPVLSSGTLEQGSGIGIIISSVAAEAKDLSVTLFFRRTTLE